MKQTKSSLSGEVDLNHQPPAPGAGALPIELTPYKEDFEKERVIRAVIVAATYSPCLVASTIGATAFYFRVRNGTG